MHKVFVIGLGKQGHVHIKSLKKRKDVIIVGGHDIAKIPNEENIFLFDSLAAGLQKTEPDTIVIATPPEIRLELLTSFVTITSLKTIIIEKPLATRFKDALAIYQLCIKHSWHFFVVHQSRFMEEFISLKESISHKKIGDLNHIKASCYGNLFNQGSHTIDLIRWITDNTPIRWIDATGSNDYSLLNQLSTINDLHQPDTDHPGFAWSNITMRLVTGADILLSSGWLDANPLPKQGPWLQRRIMAVGTKGHAEAHLASHFKEIIEGSDSRKSYEISIEHYTSSFDRWYEHVFSEINQKNNTNILKDMEDNVWTLGLLIAALVSALQHKIIPVPSEINHFELLDQYLSSANQQAIETDKPLISVIIPFMTHRGFAEKALSSWAHEQKSHPSSFEIIGIYRKQEEHLVPSLKNLLRKNDQLIFYDSNNEIELIHHGATFAKGNYLLFTESHCIAEPETIQEAIQFFQNKKGDAFYPRTIAIRDNMLAEMENKLYQQGINQLNSWDKVTLHAFGIKKEIYFSLGGFQSSYNRFATTLLGAKLNASGCQLSYAPGVAVKHYFGNTFLLQDTFIKELTRGECSYRANTTDHTFCYRYFSSHAEWTLAKGYDKKLDTMILKNLFPLLFKRCYHSFVLKNIYKIAWYAILGKHAHQSYYFFSVWLSKLSFSITPNQSKSKWDRYIRYFKKTMSFFRLHYAFSYTSPKKSCTSRHYLLDSLDETHLYGFHPPESISNETFRWSSGISAIQLFITPGTYTLRVKIPKYTSNNIELIHPTTFFINTFNIKNVFFDSVKNEFKFLIFSHQFIAMQNNWLIIISCPLPLSKKHSEKRNLGLPIKELEFEPAV